MPATLGYIRLVAGATDKKFKVLIPHASDVIKTQTRQRTVTGRADTQEGCRYRVWNLVLKVRHTEPSPNPDSGEEYASILRGTKADLITIFEYVGTLTFYDSADDAEASVFAGASFSNTADDGIGNKWTVEMIGQLHLEGIVPVITGSGAWFYVPVTLESVL